MDALRIRELLLSTLLLLLLAGSALAHAGGRVYPIPYLTDEMLADVQLDDGSVDEWYDLVGEPTMTLLDFADEMWGSVLDPADLDFRIWLAWHDEPARIYLAFAAADDLYKNVYVPGSDEVDNSMILQDNIFLGIDADHSGGEGWDATSDALEVYGQTQVYFAIPYASSGPTLEDSGLTARTGTFAWTVFPPYSEAGGGTGGENPVISVIELYVTPFDRFGDWDDPEGSEISYLSLGKVIGFAIVVNDWDPPDLVIAWTPEAMEPTSEESPPSFHVLDRRGDAFIDGILLSSEPAGPENGSAVEPVSWGRIKASLETD